MRPTTQIFTQVFHSQIAPHRMRHRSLVWNPVNALVPLTLRVASGQHKNHLGIRTHGNLVETAGARFAGKIMIQGDQLGLNLFIA
jgi:hypothetical protein